MLTYDEFMDLTNKTNALLMSDHTFRPSEETLDNLAEFLNSHSDVTKVMELWRALNSTNALALAVHSRVVKHLLVVFASAHA